MIKLKDSGVVFIEQPRGYWLDGRRLQGITTAIQRVLNPEMLDLDDLSSFHRNNIINAGEYGSVVHEAIQGYIEKDEYFGTGCENELLAFTEFCQTNGLTPIASEYLVTDYKHFASAIDIVCVDSEGKVVLVDTKTSRSYNKEHCSIQLGKYREMFELVNPDYKVSRALVFQINMREGKEPISKTHKVRLKSRKFIKEFYENEVKFWSTDMLEKTETAIPAPIQTLMGNIKTVKESLDKYRQMEKEFSSRLLEEFNKYGLDKLENEDLIISKRNSYVRESFDSKKFKEDHPELYDGYKKESVVNESISIRLR